jgi:CheY-like chemotaxis protein
MAEKTSIAMRVLVADDDQAIRQLVTTIMRREGLTVDSAADGLEAVELLKKNEYAVILLDLMMPRLDGFGVIEHLVKHPPVFKPVVLVVTAYADQKFKEVDAGVVAGVLRKPFEIADLGAVVSLCARGYDAAISQTDRAIRDFASGDGGSGTGAQN